MNRKPQLWLASSLVAAALVVYSCSSGSVPPEAPNLLEDAGPPDAGDAGTDAGNPDLLCTVADADACDGGSCLLYLMDDGGLGSKCFTGECDVVAQNCDAGLKCTYVGDAGLARGCVADGTIDEGQPCTGSPATNQCKQGLVCAARLQSDGGVANECVRFCRADAQCTQPQLCNIVFHMNGTEERPLTCGEPPPTCDVFAQDCPRAIDSCYPGTGTPACYPTGTKPDGTACQFANDCVRGSACINQQGVLSCHPMCRFPSGTPSCASGTCTKLNNNPDVGVCL